MADHPSVTYTFVADTDAEADQVNQNFADLVGYLDTRVGNLSNKDILVANASGQIVGRQMTGDVTISNTGVTSIGNNKITSAMIPAGEIANADLASPSTGVYKLLHHQVCMIGPGTPAGLYIPVPGTSIVADPLTTDNTDEMPDFFRYVSADYNVAGMSEKFLRTQLANNKNPDVDISVRLYPFVVSGPADSDIRFNLSEGSVVPGSQSEIVAAAEGMHSANSGDFDSAGDDEYMFGVSIGAGTMAASYRGVLSMSLYVHSV